MSASPGFSNNLKNRRSLIVDSDNEKLPPVDRFTKLVGDKACWLFLSAAAIACYEVFMDSAFRAPTIWVHDLTIMMCSTAFLLGGSYAAQRRQHIRITVIYDLMPKNVRLLCDKLTLLLALFYLVLLSYIATEQAIESIRLVERSGRAWDFPMPMVIRTAFSLGCLLFTAQVLAHLYDLLRGRKPPTVDQMQT